MIELTGATVEFGGRLALDLAAAPLRFEAGSLVATMGPNGSGKTTLLKLLAGLQGPTTGTIRRVGPANVAYVAQHQQQHQWMPLTVGEVLTTGRYANRGLLGRLRSNDKTTMAAAAERLQITDLLSEPFGELSGGQRQRVLVATAVATVGPCLLLDEPITGLDLGSQQLIIDVMKAERDAGRLVVITTHHLAEARHCDRVLLLNTRLIADGPPEDVLTSTNLGTVFGASVLSPVDFAGAAGVSLVIDDHGHGSH